MSLIAFLLRSSWKMVVTAIFTGFLSGVSTASLITLISRAISDGVTHSVDAIALSFIGLVAVALTTSIISQVVLIRLAQKSIFQLRLSLSRQILASELSHLERLGSSRLLATLTDDIQAVADAVRLLPFLSIDLAIVCGCLSYIIWLSWKVFLLVALLTIIALFSCQWLLKRGRYWLGKAREEQDRLFKHFRTITDGIKELKLHYSRREAFLTEDLQVSANSYRNYNTNGFTFFAVTSSWGKLIFFFAVGFVLFALPKLMEINPQTLSGYVLTFTYIMLPMETIVNSLPILTRSGVALDKIQSLGLMLAEKQESIAMPNLSRRKDWQEWKLDKIVYNYHLTEEDQSFHLGEINLSFSPGELVFIVGGNGSGKSTLAKLLVGLYVPTEGEIYFDGVLINEQNREWYRQHFAVIFADFYLFDRLLGLDRDDLDNLAAAYLEKLNLTQKVSINQGKLSTVSLSQGQRKRLALLTAFLEDRPIYLFDEWAADQDPVFRDIFYREILPQLRDRGKTVLAISHDDRYFPLGDRIIKLDYGQIEYDKRKS